MVKKFRLTVHINYEVEMPDEYNPNEDDQNDVINKLKDDIESGNQTIENEFFENLILTCTECGITLNDDEEKEDGMCVQCSALICVECKNTLTEEE